MTPQLQLLAPMLPPVGLYLRPGWNDHVALQQLVVEGRAPTGIAFDARFGRRHEELLDVALGASLDAVLDPNVQELWSEGGRHLTGVAALAWASAADDAEPALRGQAGDVLIQSLVDDVRQRGFTSILAPSHYLSGPLDRNLGVDLNLSVKLRKALDAANLAAVRSYFVLALPAASLGRAGDRMALLTRLREVDADAIWLRLHPFGTSASGPVALRRYIEICLDLQRLGLPLVAEHTGTVGLALLAFNAVGGIEGGVTLGERFDATRLQRVPPERDQPFSHQAMVYLPDVDGYVSRKEAGAFLTRRATKAALGCRDASCCRRGPEDMIRNPRRHGVLQRLREIEAIGATPAHRRPEEYLEHIRRAGDIATRLSTIHPVLEPARRRLDSWRGTLSSLPDPMVKRTAPLPAIGRRLPRATDGPGPRPIVAPSNY